MELSTAVFLLMAAAAAAGNIWLGARKRKRRCGDGGGGAAPAPRESKGADEPGKYGRYKVTDSNSGTNNDVEDF